MDYAQLAVEISLKNQQYLAELTKIQNATKTTMEKTSKHVSGLRSAWDGLGKLLTGGAIVGAFYKIAEETIQAQKSQAQLAAVLKSTGGAAGVTAEQVNNLCDKLENISAIDDDVIRSGANVLLTFTNIKKDAFEPALVAATDLSVAMGKDLNTAALLVGKSLENPGKALTALSKIGVSFSVQQQEMIKSFMQVNNVAAAQKIVLDQIGEKFGGSAAAQADTFGGSMERVKNTMGKMAETMGNRLSPALRILSRDLSDAAQKGGSLEWFVDTLGRGLSRIAGTAYLAAWAYKKYLSKGGERYRELESQKTEADTEAFKRLDDFYRATERSGGKYQSVYTKYLIGTDQERSTALKLLVQHLNEVNQYLNSDAYRKDYYGDKNYKYSVAEIVAAQKYADALKKAKVLEKEYNYIQGWMDQTLAKAIDLFEAKPPEPAPAGGTPTGYKDTADESTKGNSPKDRTSPKPYSGSVSGAGNYASFHMNKQLADTAMSNAFALKAQALASKDAAQAASLLAASEEQLRIAQDAAKAAAEDMTTGLITSINYASQIVSAVDQLQKEQSNAEAQQLEERKKYLDMYMDYAMQRELEAAGLSEQRRSQAADKEVMNLQRQISKTTNLKKRKALHDQLIEAQHERTKYKIQEEYEEKRKKRDALFDIFKHTMAVKEFKRSQQFQYGIAAMNMAMGMIGAMAQAVATLPFPAGPIVGAIEAAAVAALGGVQLAAISVQRPPMYETGTMYVPKTGPAIVHEGELVADRSTAGAFREFREMMSSGFSTGGMTFNFHGPVADKHGLVKMLKDALGAAKIKLTPAGVY